LIFLKWRPQPGAIFVTGTFRNHWNGADRLEPSIKCRKRLAPADIIWQFQEFTTAPEPDTEELIVLVGAETKR
jgi:hypothetical protein